MSSEFGLPVELMLYLADAEIEAVSWAGEKGSLVIRVVKEIGPEVGLLEFFGVSHVNLPASLTVERIEAGGLELLPTGWLGAFRPGDQALDEDETVFVFHGSWGPLYYVIARSISYRIDA